MKTIIWRGFHSESRAVEVQPGVFDISQHSVNHHGDVDEKPYHTSKGWSLDYIEQRQREDHAELIVVKRKKRYADIIGAAVEFDGIVREQGEKLRKLASRIGKELGMDESAAHLVIFRAWLGLASELEEGPEFKILEHEQKKSVPREMPIEEPQLVS
jgi:hypothetical protein